MKFLPLFALLWCFTAGGVITSIELNEAQGQIYVVSDSKWLYELDNVEVEQNNQHQLNVSIPPSHGSFVHKIGNQKSLYQFLSDSNTFNTQLARFDLPFRNKLKLTPSALSPVIPGYSSVPPFFHGSFAFVITGGNTLNAFDLRTFNRTSSVTLFNGITLGASALIYNHKTKRVVVFWYEFDRGTQKYFMQVNEFSFENSLLVPVETSFPTGGTDFSDSKGTFGAFEACNNHYWILDDQQKRLVRFDADNLGNYAFFSLGDVTFEYGGSNSGNAVYNFGDQLAYVTSYSILGYYLQEVDLAQNKILRNGTFSTNSMVPSSVFLDIMQGNIFVGLASGGPDNFVVVDLADFSQRYIVPTQ